MERNVPENVIKRHIIHYLKLKKIMCWSNATTGIWDAKAGKYRRLNGYGMRKGVADILGILPDGRFLAIECKTGYNKTTPEQDNFINEINASNGVAFVARNLGDVISRFP